MRARARARYKHAIEPWRRSQGYRIPGEFVVVAGTTPFVSSDFHLRCKMNCDPQTVAACVFQGHSAAHERHECPLVQMLVRRLHNLGIEDTPAYVDRELDKYRPVARVLGCPLVAKLSLFDLSPQSSPRWPVWRASDAVRR